MSLVVLMGVMVVVMAIGMPIAFALMASGVALMIFMGGIPDSRLLAQQTIGGADSVSLMAIPFFMLVGELMNKGGVSERIVRFGLSLVGHIRGGLGYVAIIAGFIFAGLSGSAVADTAAICSVMIPMMAEKGYKKNSSAALIAGAGCIAPILPPSICFIIFGSVSGVSIMKLFIGGLVPATLMALGLAVAWAYVCRKEKTDVYPRASFKEIVKATKESFWALLLPVILLLLLRGGVVTPTEAGVMAVFYTLILCLFVYKGIEVKDIWSIVVGAAKTTGVIMFLIASAFLIAWLIAVANIPEVLIDWLKPFMGSPMMLMIVINIIVAVVGTALDLTPTVLILTPVLMPIITAAGIDPVYFGVIFILNNAIGMITPPVGTVINAACGASKITIDELMGGIAPFMIVEFLVLFLLIIFPQIVTLPLEFFFK